MFCATLPFRFHVLDSRYCNESDLLFWSNCGEIVQPIRNIIGANIFMNYLFGKHFDILREIDYPTDAKPSAFNILKEIDSLLEQRPNPLQTQINDLNSKLQHLSQEKEIF